MFYIIILIFIVCLINKLRYNYIIKDPNILYVTVKGHDYNWNKDFYDKFLKKKI